MKGCHRRAGIEGGRWRGCRSEIIDTLQDDRGKGRSHLDLRTGNVGREKTHLVGWAFKTRRVGCGGGLVLKDGSSGEDMSPTPPGVSVLAQDQEEGGINLRHKPQR